MVKRVEADSGVVPMPAFEVVSREELKNGRMIVRLRPLPGTRCNDGVSWLFDHESFTMGVPLDQWVSWPVGKRLGLFSIQESPAE